MTTAVDHGLGADHEPGSGDWIDICPLADLDPERGVAALIGTAQVAVFWIESDSDGVYAIDNRDPASGANVLARGIVGSCGDALYVASPMHKHRFDLRSGRCLDDDSLSVGVWPVRIHDRQVQIRAHMAGDRPW